MGGIIPDPMHADKDDRHVTAELKKSKKSSASFIRSLNINSLKNKTIILILVIFIVLLLISFFVFRSSSTTEENDQNTIPEQNSPIEQQEADNTPPDYQAIAPAPISRESTQTQVKVGNGNHLERLEIPSEITDQLAQKIIDINKNESNARLQMNSQAAQLNSKYNEKPLTTTLASTHYTIQLSGSSSLESLLAYAKKYQLTNYQIYETRKNNTAWFILIKGNYSTLNDAKEALTSLPDALKTNSPWVRSGLSVQKEKQ